MKITKRDACTFFVETDGVSDICVMVDNVIKSRSVPPIRITLGQTSFAQVSGMRVGETLEWR
jgi:hypothetical protein